MKVWSVWARMLKKGMQKKKKKPRNEAALSLLVHE